MTNGTATRIAALMIALALGGCTNGTIGSCTFASGTACVDYLEHTAGSPPSLSCVDVLLGTWAEAAACPTSGRVGRCNVENENGVATVSYYAPRTSADARTDCAGLTGGTFQEE